MTAWSDRPPLSRRQVRQNALDSEHAAAQSDGGVQRSDSAGAAQRDSFGRAVAPPPSEARNQPDAPVTPIRPGGRRALRQPDVTGEGSSQAQKAGAGSANQDSLSAWNGAVGSPSAGTANPPAAPVQATGQPMTRRERRAMEAALAAAGQPLSPPAGSLEPQAPELIDAAAPAADAMFLPSRVDESEPVPVGSAPDAGMRHQRSLSSPPELIEPPREDTSKTTSFAELPLGDGAAGLPVPDSLSTLLPPSGAPIGTSPTQLPTIADLAPPRPEDAIAAPMPAPQLWSSPAPSGEPLSSLDSVPPLDWATLDRRTGSAEAVEAAHSVDLAQGAGSVGDAPVPVPHWSEQAAQEPEELPLTAEELGVSTGPITSTALVLPAIPEGADLSVPFTSSTGEVLVTGSMRLPVQYGTTGAVPRQYDHSELDALIDAADGDDAEGEAAPVRALKAVSTHTSPRDVIAMSRQKDSSRLPIVLAITAGVMMVSVTVLIVAGFLFGTF